MKTDIKQDLSILTTVNEQTFNKLFEKVVWCISDTVEKTILAKEQTAEIDLSFGTLFVNISNNEIKYKFIPSKKLEEVVSDTVLNERNLLTLTIEDSLIHKLQNTYKNFL